MTSKIERAITRAVSEKRRGMKVAVYATELVSDVYGNARPTRGQLLAVLHEMRSFVRKHQAYVLAGGQGPSRLSIIMTDEVPSAGNMGYAGLAQMLPRSARRVFAAIERTIGAVAA